MRQPPRSGMSASPSRCSSGPQKRIGMRDAPACASISSKCAETAPDGSKMQRARLVAVLDRHAVDLEERAHDLHVADVGDIAQHARRLAQQRRHHRLRGEVLRALDLDAAGERPAAPDRESLSGHFLLPCLGVGRNAEKRLHPVVLTCVFEGWLADRRPCGAMILAYGTGSVRGRHASRRASNCAILSALRSVSPMSSSPSRSRHLV